MHILLKAHARQMELGTLVLVHAVTHISIIQRSLHAYLKGYGIALINHVTSQVVAEKSVSLHALQK